jgi:LPS-assembly lipoprotein
MALSFGVVSACGFQLQGRQSLPAVLSAVNIEAEDRQSDFTQALRSSLVSSGAHMVEPAAADTTIVRIKRDEVTERVLTVSSRNIPTDYELVYDVELSVSSGGRELLPLEKFSLSRVYSFDETRLLAKEREKAILIEALARDMASVVTRRRLAVTAAGGSGIAHAATGRTGSRRRRHAAGTLWARAADGSGGRGHSRQLLGSVRGGAEGQRAVCPARHAAAFGAARGRALHLHGAGAALRPRPRRRRR